MESKYISVRGARVHNLKNINVDIPRNKLTVITGLSGSGKSSLAFDTIYAEGHRRFVESLSSYARMFMGQMDKPDVDSIEGLSPAVSIDQKTTSRNPRSTVGTVTEIYDYLRLLWARIGIPHCPVCGKEIVRMSPETIINEIMKLPEGTRFMILSPVVRDKKGTHEKVFEDARRQGYVRVRIDGVLTELSEEINPDKNRRHHIEVVIDRLIMRENIRSRLADSVEGAISLSGGAVILCVVDSGDGNGYERSFSCNFACEEHGIGFQELTPRMFSFNSPTGACPECSGLGERTVFSPDRIIPDKSLSLREGAIVCNGFKSLDNDTWNGPFVAVVGEKYGFTLDMPICEYSQKAYDALMYGAPEQFTVTRTWDNNTKTQTLRWEGVSNIIRRRWEMTKSDYYNDFMDNIPCPKCRGKRLAPEILSVTVGGLSIHDFCSLTAQRALDFTDSLTLGETERMIAKDILSEIRSRLGFLVRVGLDYLTLARSASTLSGGEAQRIRLATQIGSALVGVLYILDEPSIGLHQRDNGKLIGTLKRLRDAGNTVIVVEHDIETMLESDYLIDIGPGAGVHGGNVVACGTPSEVAANKSSVTGDFLSGRRTIAVPTTRREGNGKLLTVHGARNNNLKNIDVSFPLGCFVCVTGVSGSGKSSLVNGIMLPVLAKELNRASATVSHEKYDSIEGIENLDKVIAIDQSPIGRTPRSNPATYTGLFTEIRELFAKTADARRRAYGAGRFSFNISGGRCEACSGDGVRCIEMHFLPDVYVTCDVCHGKRYNRETLEVKYKGKDISEVLDMTADEARDFFVAVPKIAAKVNALCDVGLGYIKLGQSSTTLSGGEAQRVKLATELARRSTGRTMYILDEPTTGLHSADVEKLIEILSRLADTGNTVIVIEHNLDVIKVADWIVDLGPEGGDRGGTLVAEGTPEQVATQKGSYTGEYIAFALKNYGILPHEDK